MRLSKHLFERLEALADARGVNRSRCLRDLIGEASMTAIERSELPQQEELLVLLADRARSGNVTAIKTLLNWAAPGGEDRPAPADPFAELDAATDFSRADAIYESGRRGGESR